MELTDAHVLVTGGSRGIGAGLAKAFRAEGARVTITGRDERALAEVAELTGAAVMTGDLTNPSERNSLIATVERAHGPVDVLVNNAGWEATGGLLALSAEELERLYALNALTPAELCRQAIPGMVERGRGHIVNVSSLAATGVLPGIVAYSATKASLSQLTAGLRIELHGLPINTTLVQVGLVSPTEMMDRTLVYEPTRRAFRRFYRLGLLADTPVDKLCRATVRAVQSERRHVRFPRRAWLFSALPETPRRMTECILAGVPRRP